MPYQVPNETYSGKIEEITIGVGEKAITIGGQTTLAFYDFEGDIPHRPVVAMEVYDNNPQEWVETLKEPLGDVLEDPVAWAKKCQDAYHAEAICLQLAGTDPNGDNRSADEAAATVKAVLDAIELPLIVFGCGNAEKDKAVMEKVAAVAAGKNILLGPAVEENYKTIAAAAMGFNHNVIAQSPCDVNLSKQLNILLTQMGLPKNRIVIDPSTGALGYGMDYTYTIMERLKIAALQQGDEMTRMPIISVLGPEVWKTKESRVSVAEEPTWGDPGKRAISWEIMTATAMAVAGADLLVMRHPQAVEGYRKAVVALA